MRLTRLNNGHADASPSAASQWINCPASVTQARGRVRKATPYTREGTAAHEVAELMIHGLQIPAMIEVEGETIEITDDMIEHARTYVDYVDKRKHGAWSFATEVRVSLDWLAEPVHGTADTLLLYTEESDDGSAQETVLEVVDLKFGKGYAVVAEDNPQLRIYGLGALETNDRLLTQFSSDEVIDKVRMTIVQPRLSGGPGIEMKTISALELRLWNSAVLEPAVEKIAAGDPTEVPGDWCRWCVRAGECRALADKTLLEVQSAFSPIPEQVVRGLDNNELANALDKAEMITAWINLIRAEASSRVDVGQTIPGWKLVPKRAMRKWIDEDDAEDALRKAGVDINRIVKLVSPAAVERDLKACRMSIDILKPLVVKESSGTTLVRAEDLREGLALDAKSVFSRLE